MTQTGNRNLFRNAERGSGVSLDAHSKHPPPHAAGVGTSGWKGWWFFFRVSSGTLGAEASMVGVVLFFRVLRRGSEGFVWWGLAFRVSVGEVL